MSRLGVLNEINILMDRKCNGCRTHYELAKQHGSNFSKIDNHCNRQCETGKQLQELGKQLTN
ncbi:zinc-finger domain-containing protein [Paenibacillus illinoisensis]|uniref:zinc-finger domain-containing protein n=1 Tax=Paenibacillus illinoisensis TaxID=59845 RepID=UPI003C6DC00A